MRGGCCSRPPISTAQARLELRALIKARNSQEAAAQSVSASRVSGRNETSIETSAGLNRQGARLCTERHDGWWPGVAQLQGSQTGPVGHAGQLTPSSSSLQSALLCVQGGWNLLKGNVRDMHPSPSSVCIACSGISLLNRCQRIYSPPQAHHPPS